MRVTVRLVAQEAGVSTGTVSRYINQHGYVSEDAEEKIKTAFKKLGCNRSDLTPLARKKHTYRLGLLTSFSKDIFNSRYHTHLLAGIMKAIQDTNYNLTIIFLKEKDYSNVQEILSEYGIDGLFILTWRIHPNLIRLIQNAPKNLPVMIFNDYDPKVQVNCIYSDVTQGIEMAVDYLVEKKKRRKIGFLKGPSMIHFGEGRDALHMSSIDSFDKWEGFQKAMKKHGLQIHENWVRECDSYTMPAGYEKTMEILDSKTLPDAIVCSNDETAIGALNALKEHKVKCPDEIAIVGFDGIEKGELTSPPITTVEQLLNSMGYEGGKKLVDIADGKLIDPIHTKFVPRLVIRGSA